MDPIREYLKQTRTELAGEPVEKETPSVHRKQGDTFWQHQRREWEWNKRREGETDDQYYARIGMEKPGWEYAVLFVSLAAFFIMASAWIGTKLEFGFESGSESAEPPPQIIIEAKRYLERRRLPYRYIWRGIGDGKDFVCGQSAGWMRFIWLGGSDENAITIETDPTFYYNWDKLGCRACLNCDRQTYYP